MTYALRVTAVLLLIGSALFPADINAHEIPASVTVRVIIKQDSSRVRVLVRAPLAAMRDIDFPLRPGSPYLDLRRTDSLLPQAATTWIVNPLNVFADGVELRGTMTGTRTSLASDRAFASLAAAERHMRDAPLDARLDAETRGVEMDVAIEYPVQSPHSMISFEPAFARLGVRTTTIVTMIDIDGREQMLEYQGDPGLVRLSPRWYHAARQFVVLGFYHILGGLDHLLFIICLVLPFRKLRPLVGIVTAFTVAHSLTLAAAALGWAPDALWFPPLVEVLIALSILYMALENIFAALKKTTPAIHRRWLMAFGFGLIHGFGFAFALRESLQFAGSHLAFALVSFNIGVELGQIFALCLAVPLLGAVYDRILAEPPAVIIIISAFVTHTAWDWLVGRWVALREYNVEWTLPALLPLIRVVMACVIVIGVVAIGARLLRLRGSRIRGEMI